MRHNAINNVLLKESSALDDPQTLFGVPQWVSLIL